MKRNLGQMIVISLVLLSFSFNGAAQKTVVPIVYFNEDRGEAGAPLITNGNLLGGVENGKWLDAKTTFGKLKSNENYSLLNFESGKKGEYVFGKFNGDSITCTDTYYIETQLKVAANFALGANANWNPFPRQPKKTSAANANYKKSVKDVLRLHGLGKSPAKIDRATSIDLDGDGREEVILEANYIAEDSNQFATIGTYSFIIIRKIIGGKVQNLFVGGFFLKHINQEFDGDYSLSGIADLNGDGKLELFVAVAGYEENWLNVYEMKAGKAVEITDLSYYCGL
jgi:hypothetical protein